MSSNNALPIVLDIVDDDASTSFPHLKCPPTEGEASLFSRFFFSWLTPFLLLGYSRPLEEADLGPVLESDKASRLTQRLRSSLFTTTSSKLLLTRKHIARAIISLVSVDMLHAGIGKLFGDLLGFIAPLSVAGIIAFCAARSSGVSDTRTFGVENGFLWLVAGVVSSVLQNSLLHRHHHHSIRSGMHVRVALTGVVFEKSMSITAAARTRIGAGKIQTLSSADSNAIGLLCWFIHYAWAAPLQLAICMAMLVAQLGWAPTVVAVCTLLCLTPLQGRLVARVSNLTKAARSATDKRMSALNEALDGIRVVKALGWESAFSARITIARKDEQKHKKAVAMANAISMTLVEAGQAIDCISSCFCDLHWHVNETSVPVFCYGLIDSTTNPKATAHDYTCVDLRYSFMFSITRAYHYLFK